jgi:hypothetical protein
MELSIKQDKHNIQTLNFIIHKVRFFKNLQKNTLTLAWGGGGGGGGWNAKNHQCWW